MLCDRAWLGRMSVTHRTGWSSPVSSSARGWRAARIALWLAVGAAVTGCAVTLADVQASKAGGTARVYTVSADDAWRIARTVLRWEGADAIEEHREQGMMLTSFGPGWVGGGVGGAWVERVDSQTTKVTVVTSGRMRGQIKPLLESTFHRRFEEALAIVKSGQPLPVRAP